MPSGAGALMPSQDFQVLRKHERASPCLSFQSVCCPGSGNVKLDQCHVRTCNSVCTYPRAHNMPYAPSSICYSHVDLSSHKGTHRVFWPGFAPQLHSTATFTACHCTPASFEPAMFSQYSGAKKADPCWPSAAKLATKHL